MNAFWTWWSKLFDLMPYDPLPPPVSPLWTPGAPPLADTVAAAPSTPVASAPNTPVASAPNTPVASAPNTPVASAPAPPLLQPKAVVPPLVIADPPAANAALRPLSAGPTIAIMNFSTVLRDADVQAALAAIQVQIDRDFRPLWGLSANLLFVANIKRPPIGAWVVQILDTSDVSGALGYHDMTNAGLPVGKIFAKDDQKYGLSWTITLSHEILEMLGDPYVDTTVFVQDSDTTGMLYAYELCDATEADELGYAINGIKVSDFVTPAYFEAGRLPHSTKFDFRAVLTAPLTLAAGGYMSLFAVNPKTTGWSQQTDAKGVAPRLAMKLARRESRISRRARPANSA